MGILSRCRRALDGERSDPEVQPTLTDPVCQICNAQQFREPVYHEWCQRLGIYPALHRKAWEFAYICQALERRGKLRPGMSGVGFGVGTEPLPALFASRGCSILATDQGDEAARASGWKDGHQHGGSLESLQRPAVCGEAEFRQRVSYRPVDMRDITGLGQFDFCWSSCSFEHLGSAEAGFKFVCNSVDLLRPGGVAVHTTEMLCSNDRTIELPSTVLYSSKAIRKLVARLRAKGCRLDLNLTRGNDVLDGYVDVPPYRHEPHIRLLIARSVTTSVGIIADR